VTRTEVSDMFSRNKKRREIERALVVLEDAARLRRETRQPERGRAAAVWMPVSPTPADPYHKVARSSQPSAEKPNSDERASG
jgi:hypothetical protein